MDWKFITHHLVSGNIVVMAALVVYFIILRVIGKKQAIGSKLWISQVQADDSKVLLRTDIALGYVIADHDSCSTLYV